MNTSAIKYSAEPSWSRRCSIESILSIQGKETDIVCDTSDTEGFSQDEFEPVTEPDGEDELPPVEGESSGDSDNKIISTKVVAVTVGDDGDLQLADSEQTDSEGLDSEVDLADYWRCAQCHTTNNNPLYRYCEKCFKVRKDFFPPRPKRKHKRPLDPDDPVPRTLSQDSGVESQLSQNDQPCSSSSQNTPDNTTGQVTLDNRLLTRHLKRRAESADRNNKRIKPAYSETDSSNSETEEVVVSPLTKTISDPALTVENVQVKLTKKVISNVLKNVREKEIESTDSKESKEKSEKDDNMCIICCAEPKSGVFVHGRIAHICCCYKCAVKVWSKAKRCPVCNCRVSNVLKAVVM